MANFEEIRQLQKLMAIEEISFNEQLGRVVSISLTTCSWFFFLATRLPFLVNGVSKGSFSKG